MWCDDLDKGQKAHESFQGIRAVASNPHLFTRCTMHMGDTSLCCAICYATAWFVLWRASRGSLAVFTYCVALGWWRDKQLGLEPKGP